MARSTIFNREITIDLAERVLSTSVHVEKKQVTIELIQEKVCGFYDMDPKLLQAKTRKREIVQARQISMYLSKNIPITRCPVSEIYWGERIMPLFCTHVKRSVNN